MTGVLAFDPGSARAWWAHLEAREEGAVYLGAGSVEQRPERLRELLRQRQPALVAVEGVMDFLPPASPKESHARIASGWLHLLATAQAAGMISALAAAEGLAVLSSEANAPLREWDDWASHSWRRALTGLRRPSKGDVMAAVRAAVRNLPKRRLSEHEYDALGLGLVALRRSR